ncbi:MAG: PEP-CTERM sorting domain-containing protein [Planctomycetota bacterium]
MNYFGGSTVVSKSWIWRSLVCGSFVSVFLACSLLQAQSWVANGPSRLTGGQVEGIVDRPVSGAMHTVIAHATDADILYAGGTNGGLWKTTNATSGDPTWTSLIDDQSSLAIGALAFDPTDATGNTIIAGNGRYSSLGRTGGSRDGLLYSNNGGSSWARLDGGGTMTGRNISGVAVRGNTIVASVNVADSFTFGNIGIFRSTDGGATFSQISQGDGTATGLPGGVSYDLASDPTNNATMYTSAIFAENLGGQNGIYKTSDTGSSWTKVSNSTMDALITNSTSNVEMSVGNSGQVYAGIINAGRLDGLFRSGDGGSSWTQLDLPVTNEPGGDVGTNPRGGKGPTDGTPAEIAGGQGAIHFSIAADPNNDNVVYVGGDRQPGPGEAGITSWPNSIGASNFTGRLFRLDASLPTGSQYTPLTHRGGSSDNMSTVNNSAPHADSREITFDANGNMIEVDDGGIYRRTSPEVDNVGDWFSLNGNLQTTEFHSVDWDQNSNIIFGGTQDVGTPEQTATGSGDYRTVSQGDGGEVASFDNGDGTSTRYTSFQNLGSFRRRVIDANNNVVSTAFPSLSGMGDRQFYTPIEVNQFNGDLYIGGDDNVYQSTNQGNSVTAIADSTNESVSSLDSGAANNVDALWVGRGDSLFYQNSAGRLELRTTSGGALVEVTSYGGSQVVDLAMNELDFMDLVATDIDNIFYTDDAGATFVDVTGDLFSFGGDDIWSVEMFEFDNVSILFAGLRTGDVYYSSSMMGLGAWHLLGDLPNAPIRDLEYNSEDDILLAGLQGRGAYVFGNISELTAIPEPSSMLILTALIGLTLARRNRLR